MRILQHFAEPEFERSFLRAERAERGQAIRALIIVALATLLSYVFLNPIYFPQAGLVAYSEAAAFLILVMSGFFLLTRTSYYLESPWVDLPVFVVMAIGMIWLTMVLAGQAAITGFPPIVMVMLQMGILVIYASVGFAGTFRLFLMWAFGVLVLFTAWLLTREVSPIAKLYTLGNFSTLFIFGLYFNWGFERRARKVFIANRALEAEREKTETLLYNVLPQAVAARLRAGEAVADSFSDLTAIFVDLAGFSVLTKRLSPGHLVETLNLFFSAADRCADRHGVEKVKTIGDAYLAVLGGMASTAGDSKAAILFARDLITELETLAADTGLPLQARIGVHTGPAVGGVIGSARLAYDYWGDTMNIASRLQGAAPLNGIAVSEATYFRTQAMQDYQKQSMLLKGIGETPVYSAILGTAGDHSGPDHPSG
jgi:adenylate cyclase